MSGLPSIPGPGPDRELIRPAEWMSPERYAAMLDHLTRAEYQADWPDRADEEPRKVADISLSDSGETLAITPEGVININLLWEDRAQWPFGHPCRNCDELAMNHPVTGPPVDCREWR